MLNKCDIKFFQHNDNFSIYQGVKSILVKDNTGGRQSKFCIGIPTYNRVETLKETIESCLKQQQIDDYIILICDNNPQRHDDTELYINQLASNRIKYFKHEKNIGMYGNINRIFELSNSTYTVCIHDDDLLYPDYLKVVNKVLEAHKDIDILFPYGNSWDSENDPVPIEKNNGKFFIYKNSSLDCAITNPHPPTGIVVKTDSFIKFGGFDLAPYPSNDYYFNVNAFENLQTYTLTKSLYVYRWGVNTTLKLETILAFIKVDLPLKEYVILKYPFLKLFSKSILVLYSDYKVKTLKRLYPTYNINQLGQLIVNPSGLEMFKAKLFKLCFTFIQIIRHKSICQKVNIE